MNKKILLLLLILTASVIVGCSKESGQINTEASVSIIQDENASEVIGKVEEIKDFMLVVTDADNVSYAFTFEEKPEGLDNIAVGDMVLVTYTGTISEVDPFTGKIAVEALPSDYSNDFGENNSDENQGGYPKDLRSSGITDPYVNPEVKFSNLTSVEDLSALSYDLENTGVKKLYIKDYIDYVNIYNETAPKSVLDGWNTLDKINYDAYEIADVWEQKYPEFIGICCRIAAFTLLRDDIILNNTEFQRASTGSLIFDSYAFEIMPDKYMTDENLKAYEDFYAPIPTNLSTDKEEQKKVLELAIKDRGVEFKNSNLKFIGLVVHDTVDESNPFLFIDHAGVIYEKNGSVYLLEKLAFQEPYQWIKFPSEDEIIKYFESKYNLDTTGNMAEPIYMINNKLF